MSFNEDLISLVVSESDANLGAVTSWTCEIISRDIEDGSLRVLGYTIWWCDVGNMRSCVHSDISTNILPILSVFHNFNNSWSLISWFRRNTNVFNVWDLSHICSVTNNITGIINKSTHVVNIFSWSIMVLELIEKHTSEMDWSSTTDSSHVWCCVFNNPGLMENKSVWGISEMEGYVIIILLAISWDGNNWSTWNVDWSSHHFNKSIWFVLHGEVILSKSNLEVTHIVLHEIFTLDWDTSRLIERSIPWFDHINFGFIVIAESDIRKGKGFSIRSYLKAVVVITGITIR